MSSAFTAFVIEDQGGKPKGAFKPVALSELPDHDVLVEVAYSTVNYKDGLAVTGKGRIARKLPMVAGIDLAGTVVESRSPDWRTGDRVVVNGWGLSETQWGGYARFQRVRPEWLVRLPDAFSLEQVMGIGTAGYTAALCVDALERWGAIEPGGKEVLVTGAAGGVGSVAVALLAKRGYAVTASTGRPETHDYLRGLGATGFIDRAALLENGPPLQKERWAGGVDPVGGQTLVNALAQMVWGGAITACGLAGSPGLPGTVLPHILRSVALLGIDSVMAPASRRAAAWDRLARDLDPAHLAAMYEVHPFGDLPELAERILAGRIRGRVVLDLSA
ncbi:oxidoreductase [Azospirillum sp. RWY-5-1]|uniref:Oxidoreductase n=1 Tax=Azospirillum oleiclasticum TaxID=2735135 RepID=A0ABX2TEZ4_9PROT|nr:MDR family oxidoreductase [Azospirillum oleiclasticum]NYZ14957.1 oxidoreductase [Azospirillum oleiclasticum]NYZ22719.1 oxidoreductase [Azospirillum oleiclasticum]